MTHDSRPRGAGDGCSTRTDDLRAEKREKKVGCVAQEGVFLFPRFRKKFGMLCAVRAEAAGRDTSSFFFFFC